MAIKFGTSGWRDIIADNFTYPNLRICAQAIAEQIYREKNHNKPVTVGYDTRFFSEEFAYEAARILANNAIETRFSDRDVPTPVVAFDVLRSGSSAGINITASHNSYDYSGLKLSSAWGGPALKDTTNAIEGLCRFLVQGDMVVKNHAADPHLTEKLIHKVDFKEAYLKHIQSLVDVGAFKKSKLHVIVDVMHGTSHGYLAEFLRQCGCEVEVLNEERDVTFEGGAPDPSPEKLQNLIAAVKKKKAHLGFALDGDADRFAVVDAGGAYYSPNEILTLLTWYLHVSRGWQGVVARSVMTTHGIDAVARKYGLTVRETPVGFKYIGEIMKEADSVYPSTDGEFVMGGEESGGFTMRGHVPEKDGILACLIVAEMVASQKKSVTQLLHDLYAKVGVFMSRRLNIHATPELLTALKDWFRHKPPTEIGGLSVRRILDMDGTKFIFHDGSWLGVRFSGTEPVVRVYFEGSSEKQVDHLKKSAEGLVISAKKM